MRNKISLYFVSNYKASYASKGSKNKLFFKTFLIYILFLDYYLNKVLKFSVRLTFSKNRKNIININRAPYRYKLSRHQLTNNRYFYAVNIILSREVVLIKTFKSAVELNNRFFKNLKKFSFFFFIALILK